MSETSENGKTIDESLTLTRISKLKVDELADLTNAKSWIEKVLFRA